MSRFSISAFSMFPYYTKSNAKSEDEKRLQGLLYAVKNGGRVHDGEGTVQNACAWFAGVVRENADQLADFISQRHQLLPVPSSSVTSLPPSANLWPMYDLAQRIHMEALVCSAPPVLTRTTAIAKAHTVARDDKPSVADHRDSLTVDLSALSHDLPVTLLDDVLTSGTSAMGCMLALRRDGFFGEVRLLTVTHTVAPDYSAGATASARSNVIWFDDRDWRRAWRPPKDVVFV